MTPEHLREIAARHAEDRRPTPSTWTREQEAEVCSRMYADRGELLDLLRELLNTTSKHTLPDGSGWNYHVHDDARARAMRAALGGSP